jgi:Tat protein translocase TatB subunit
MPSLGPLEIVLVAAVALIVFGPEKLPDIARTVGRAASQMRRMASEFKEEFATGLEADEDDEAVTGSTPARPQGGPRAGPGRGGPGTRRPDEEPAPPELDPGRVEDAYGSDREAPEASSDSGESSPASRPNERER